MKKFLIVFLIVLIAAPVATFAVRDWLIKTVLQSQVTRLTGFPTKIASVHFDFPFRIQIQDLEIKNPSGFKEPVFARLPEIFMMIDLPQLLRGERIHIPELRLNLQEINIEKNEKGISNISLLKAAGDKGAAQKPKEPKKAMPFLLDRLELTIRKVQIEDTTGLMPQQFIPQGVVPKQLNPGRIIPTGLIQKGIGGIGQGVKKVGEAVPGEMPGKKVSLDLEIEKQVFTNIDRPEAIVNVILYKVLYGKTMGHLKDFGVNPDDILSQTTGLVTQSTGDLVRGAGSMVQESLNLLP